MFSYLTNKRQDVLKEIKPICEVFGIKDFDYIIDTETGKEELKLNNTRIGCCSNSVLAVKDELIAYIFVNTYCKNRSLGAFRTQTLNEIKRYWLKE